MSTRVSVIVTCYNLGHYLRDAIDSVVAQTFSDYDILIVDDGSTDPATIECLDRFEASGTRLLRTANHGLPAARNAGIGHTTGEYICCLDADDLLEPTWLEHGAALLDASPEFAYASHWLRAFGEEEWPWQPMRCDLGMLLDVNTLNGAALFRRSLWQAVGGFDESMREGCEDWEFWIRVTTAGFRGAIIPEVQHRYRRRAESMSRTMNHERLYADLIERHPAAYHEHLLDLLLRREHTIATLQHSIEDMETEFAAVLAPALEERRHELARGRARLDEVRRVQALARRIDEQAAALHELDTRARDALRHAQWETGEQVRRAEWLASEREGLLHRLASAEAEVRSGAVQRAEAERASAELESRAEHLLRRSREDAQRIDALQQSWSWRLTAPVRWLSALVAKARPSA